MSLDSYPSNSTCNQSGSWADQLVSHKSGLFGTSGSIEVHNYSRVVTYDPNVSSLSEKSTETGNNHDNKTFRSEFNMSPGSLAESHLDQYKPSNCTPRSSAAAENGRAEHKRDNSISRPSHPTSSSNPTTSNKAPPDKNTQKLD